MKKSQLRKIIRESIKELINEQSPCDNTMNGSCAQQWLPPTLNWPNMTNFACTGNPHYNGAMNNHWTGATSIMTQTITSTVGPSYTINPNGNYSDINNFVNSINQFSGNNIQQPQKGQLKRKLAKGYWAYCMNQACNC